MQDSARGEVLSKGAGAAGYVARLGGVTVLEVVRFECLRGGRRVLRVSSRGQVAYLYMRDGRLVHAATPLAVGVPALHEMLEWPTGSIESGVGGWPAEETITPAAADSVPELAALGLGAASRTGVAPVPRSEPARSKHATVVIAPTGEVLEGAGLHALPEAAAYSAQTAELIGGFLGFDRFVSIEADYGGAQLLIGRSRTGELLARHEKNPADLALLRAELLAPPLPAREGNA